MALSLFACYLLNTTLALKPVTEKGLDGLGQRFEYSSGYQWRFVRLALRFHDHGRVVGRSDALRLQVEPPRSVADVHRIPRFIAPIDGNAMPEPTVEEHHTSRRCRDLDLVRVFGFAVESVAPGGVRRIPVAAWDDQRAARRQVECGEHPDRGELNARIRIRYRDVRGVGLIVRPVCVPVSPVVSGMIRDRAGVRNPIKGPEEKFDRRHQPRVCQIRHERLIAIDDPWKRLDAQTSLPVPFRTDRIRLLLSRLEAHLKLACDVVSDRPDLIWRNHRLENRISFRIQRLKYFAHHFDPCPSNHYGLPRRSPCWRRRATTHRFRLFGRMTYAVGTFTVRCAPRMHFQVIVSQIWIQSPN